MANIQDVIAARLSIDTVIITAAGDSVHHVSFEYSQLGIRNEGWSRTFPPICQLQVTHDPMSLHLVVSQLREGS